MKNKNISRILRLSPFTASTRARKIGIEFGITDLGIHFVSPKFDFQFLREFECRVMHEKDKPGFDRKEWTKKYALILGLVLEETLSGRWERKLVKNRKGHSDTNQLVIAMFPGYYVTLVDKAQKFLRRRKTRSKDEYRYETEIYEARQVHYQQEHYHDKFVERNGVKRFIDGYNKIPLRDDLEPTEVSWIPRRWVEDIL